MPELRLFGILKEQYPFLEGDVHAIDTQSLLNELERNYPGFTQNVYMIAVNHTVCKTNTELQKEDLVVLMPPFSGG